MFHDLTDCQPLIDIPVQHRLDQVNARVTQDPRDPELVVHYLINAVEGVLLIDEGVKKDTQGPDILFLAAVGFSLQDFWSCVICPIDKLLVDIKTQKNWRTKEEFRA